jgi:chromosome segregation ATPase
MDSSYINNKRRHSKEIRRSYVKPQEKKLYYSSGEDKEDSITEEYIEEKKEIKCIPSQLQNNNKKSQRMEFRRKEFEQINKNQKIFLEKIDELKSSVESLRKDNRLLEIKVFNLQKWREDEKKEREDDHETIRNLKKERDDDHKTIRNLKKEKVFLQDQIDQLRKEKDINALHIYNLTKEVKNLSSYAFSGKLRKLLKNLLNYLITYFEKNMKYDQNQNKLYFTESPNLKDEKDDIDSVKALNSILDIIFYHSTKSDHIVHYVDTKARINKAYIKNITVFKNSSEFFDYFNISKKERNILLRYIPEKYFTTINNANFESRIPDLLSKLRK